jgi:hypothetical protein
MVKPAPPDDVRETWPAPNFDNPKTRDHASYIGITVSLTSLTFVVVACRTYVRFYMLRTPGWDDLFIFFAAVSGSCFCKAS